MAEHKHIILEGQARAVDYSISGFPKSKIIERENPVAHSNMLREQY